MTRPLRILHLEDSPLDAELIAATLAADGLPAEVQRVATEADYRAALERGGFDAILADYSLPSFDGVAALALAQAHCPHVPFIFVSGALGEERAIETLKRGATDYVLKTRLGRLVPALRRALREADVSAEQRRAADALRQSEVAQRLLAEAGRVLASSLDYEQQLRDLARVLTPSLADWCIIDVVTPEGNIRRLVVHHWDGANHVPLDDINLAYPADAASARGPARVLGTLKAEVYPDVAVLLADPDILETESRLLRALNLQSVLVVPMVARGQALGVMTLASTQQGRRFGQADLDLALEVAHRAALAGDNARLYAEAQRLNAELEERVAARTNELRAANAELAASREQLRNLSARLQAAREEERTSLAREVHDELGGALTGLKMDLARLRQAAEARGAHDLAQQAQAMSHKVDSTIQTVRRIATDLRPGILDDFGLFAALEWQLHDFQERSGIECVLQADEPRAEVHPECATAVFRVFQEALTNVARHAHASRVEVQVRDNGDELKVEIRDNGKGITEEEAFGSRSLGLLGMRERVHLLAGELEVSGAPGQGTVVAVKVPWPVLQAGPAVARRERLNG